MDSLLLKFVLMPAYSWGAARSAPGLFAFAGFFLVLAALIVRTGIAPAFAAAIAVALALQAGSLWTLRQGLDSLRGEA
jgi:hypothetical protein